MNNRLAVSLIAAVLLAPGVAFAQSTTARGAQDGAATGGEVGGPVGAIVGGTVGAAIGAAVEIPNAVITGLPRDRSVVAARAGSSGSSTNEDGISEMDPRGATSRGDFSARIFSARLFAARLFAARLWQRSLGSPDRPAESRSSHKTERCRQRVDGKILQPCMPAGRQELQQFDHTGEGDDESRRRQAVARIGQSESKPEQHEGKRMLAVLSQV